MPPRTVKKTPTGPRSRRGGRGGKGTLGVQNKVQLEEPAKMEEPAKVEEPMVIDDVRVEEVKAEEKKKTLTPPQEKVIEPGETTPVLDVKSDDNEVISLKKDGVKESVDEYERGDGLDLDDNDPEYEPEEYGVDRPAKVSFADSFIDPGDEIMAQVEDCKALLSELKEEDKRLRLKRRWLMDKPLSERDQKRIKKLNPLSDKSILEAMLREDDVYCDSIKDFVERVSGAHTSGKFHHFGPEKSFENLAQIKDLSSLLDNMINKGLCYFSEIVTEGLLEFEKIKWKMKRIIRKYLPSYLDSKDSDLQMRKDQISSLLNNPEYFSGNCRGLCSPSESFHAAAIRVLDTLEELPRQILEAMHGRLNGEVGSIPKFKNIKVRKKRELLPAVRRLCMKMLSELDEGKQPSELLVDALSIAGLTLQLILGHTYVTEFKRFSPKVEALQNSIAKAIRNVNAEKKVSIKDLEEMYKKLHLLLGCKLKFSKRSLRFVVKSLLIEYLIDCSDLESIPESLIQILNEINKIQHPSSSAGSTPKEEVEKEVEFLLCLSAQMKQIIWGILPGAQVEQDFVDAYMEEPKDGDEEEDNMDEVLMPQTLEGSYDPYRMTESIGETNLDVLSVSTYKADDSSPLLSSNSGLTLKQEPLDIDNKGSFWSNDFPSLSCSESKPFIRNQTFDCNKSLLASLEDINEAKTDGNMHGKLDNIQHQRCTRKNNYLSIQRACDETAMAIYQCFDGMINDFAS